MARIAVLLSALVALLAPASGLASPRSELKRTLNQAMSGAGTYSGAYVMDADSDAVLFRWRPDTPRTLASNTKLFTAAAVLGRYGPDSSLATSLLGTGRLSGSTWRGSLYLRGGGDPTFGTRAFARRAYGSDSTVEALAEQLHGAGIKSVTGSVYGDESVFDPLRGGPDSGYGTSIWVGPLSAVDVDRGLANTRGTAFQKQPPQFAAAKLKEALKAEGVRVAGKARVGAAPDDAVQLVESRSPPVASLLTIQNKGSDNFFAEMLLKGLPVAREEGGPWRAADAPLPSAPTAEVPAGVVAARPGVVGTTGGGARLAMAYARSLGARVKLVDGSGLSPSNRAAPKQVATLLDGLREKPGFSKLYASLPIAGRDGTLSSRMRHGRARGRCRAKTGTITGVSALSGYCRTRGGRTLVFSVLMNRANVYTARSIQDRVANALAGYRG